MADKAMRQLVKNAEHQGFEVSRGRGGHYRFLPPRAGTPVVFGSSTPGDPRAYKNVLAKLRRAGFTG